METYFIKAITSQIKVGVSQCVRTRFQSLCSSSPVSLRLLGSVECRDKEIERFILSRFKSLRLHGEWLQSSRELESCIANILAGYFDAEREEFIAIKPLVSIERQKLVNESIEALYASLRW